MATNKSKLQKRLEALKKMQQTNAIVEEGGIQSQALLTGAGEQRPSEDAHILDLLERTKARANVLPKKIEKARAKHITNKKITKTKARPKAKLIKKKIRRENKKK